jgi:predicted ArsR family transcriptional regulator
MPMLARMVLAMARRVGANPADAMAVGEAEGATRAARYDAAPSALEALVADLDRLGFDPLVTAHDAGDDADDDPDGPVTAVVAFANCPFADLARDHPDLVCALHRGLIAGFVAQMGDAEVTEFCPLASRTPCQVALTSR